MEESLFGSSNSSCFFFLSSRVLSLQFCTLKTSFFVTAFVYVLLSCFSFLFCFSCLFFFPASLHLFLSGDSWGLLFLPISFHATSVSLLYSSFFPTSSNVLSLQHFFFFSSRAFRLRNLFFSLHSS